VSGQPYKPFEPDWTVAPGEMLAEVLEDRGLSPFGLAGPGDPLLAVFGENLEAVRGILAGSLPVTAEIAAELERALRPAPPARFWLNAEKIYQDDLRLAGQDAAGWYYRGFRHARIYKCDGRSHDAIVRDRDLMAELERAAQCPYC